LSPEREREEKGFLEKKGEKVRREKEKGPGAEGSCTLGKDILVQRPLNREEKKKRKRAESEGKGGKRAAILPLRNLLCFVRGRKKKGRCRYFITTRGPKEGEKQGGGTSQLHSYSS